MISSLQKVQTLKGPFPLEPLTGWPIRVTRGSGEVHGTGGGRWRVRRVFYRKLTPEIVILLNKFCLCQDFHWVNFNNFSMTQIKTTGILSFTKYLYVWLDYINRTNRGWREAKYTNLLIYVFDYSSTITRTLLSKSTVLLLPFTDPLRKEKVF